MTEPLFLVADVGGTNTRVAMARGRTVLPESIRRYRNSLFNDLAPVLRQYRVDYGGAAPDGACVAIAGPVTADAGELTNLSWSIDVKGLCGATEARHGAILNDLQAQGYAVGTLSGTAFSPVLPGRRRVGGSRLVVGIGTGFNAVPVHDTGGPSIVPPSEAGHVNLPIRTPEDARLAAFISDTHGFAAVEDVLSGRGLIRVYNWLATEAESDARPDAAEIMALASHDPLAKASVAQFVHVMGTVIGNLVLTHLPFGGVYLVGGVARAMLPHLDQDGFRVSYRDKGRFAGFMDQFPVSLVLDDYAALTGCATFLTKVARAPSRAASS